MLLRDKDLNEAIAISEKIRTEFASISYEKAGRQTVSLGVVQAKLGETADMLCSRADKALYIAKASGKNQVAVVFQRCWSPAVLKQIPYVVALYFTNKKCCSANCSIFGL